jgi:hypothetical protein
MFDAFVYRFSEGKTKPLVVITPSEVDSSSIPKKTLQKIGSEIVTELGKACFDAWIGVPVLTLFDPPKDLVGALFYVIGLSEL